MYHEYVSTLESDQQMIRRRYRFADDAIALSQLLHRHGVHDLERVAFALVDADHDNALVWLLLVISHILVG